METEKVERLLYKTSGKKTWECFTLGRNDPIRSQLTIRMNDNWNSLLLVSSQHIFVK